MTTAADVTARVDRLAAAFRGRDPARAKYVDPGPLRAVLEYGDRFDRLECGHTVVANPRPRPRRCCVFCKRAGRHA